MTTTTTTPVAQRERIQMLDVIRGFALLGILLMNIEYFQRPMTAMLFGLDQSLAGIDKAVGWSVFTFVQGKFYTMFSLLFGIGFVIFCDRAKEKQHPRPRLLFLRRAAVLALFGWVHPGLNVPAAYGLTLPGLVDQDGDGWPNVIDQAPGTKGYI